jgi:chromate transport protein ChrA
MFYVCKLEGWKLIMLTALGFLMLKKPNLRFIIMIVCIIPSIVAFFLLAFLPNSPHLLWPKWGFFFMSTTSLISGLLLQTVSAYFRRSVKTTLTMIPVHRYQCGGKNQTNRRAVRSLCGILCWVFYRSPNLPSCK